MAISLLGGLTVATQMTIFFVPALFAAWIRAERTPAPSRAFAPGTAG
jgi:multidrug efflux pump